MILFCLYGLFLLSLGIWDAFREKHKPAGDSFFVNSRESGAWLVGISIIASCVGGSATIGMAGLAWKAGTPAFWWLGSGACGLVLLSVFLARKVRQSGARTMPEMIDAWLGASGIAGMTPRRLVSLIIIPSWLAILAAQFTAMSGMIGVLTGLSPDFALLMGVLLVTGYSILGGQASVMRSDMPQFIIMVLGLLLTLLFLYIYNPGAAPGIQPELINGEFPASRLNYFLAVLGGSYVVCPMLFGRLLSARDEKAAIMGCRIGVIGLILLAILIVMIGIMARGFVPMGCEADEVLSSILEKMPAWAAAPLMLALLSAVLSSADSCLITASTILCNDVAGADNNHPALFCRLAALALGLLAWLLATFGHGILDLLLMANDIYVSGVVAPVFFAMLLPPRFKPDVRVSLVAIFIGGLCGLMGAVYGMHELVYAGMAFSGGLIILNAIYCAYIPRLSSGAGS